MRVLGIDPGTGRTGYGIIDEIDGEFEVVCYGCITTETGVPIESRLHEIAHDIEHLLEKYEPDTAAVEEIFFSKNTTTAIAVAQARGVIIQKITEKEIPVTSYNPMRIKVSVCSDGKAKKFQIQKMVQMLLNLDTVPTPDDAADALAIAICHHNTTRKTSLYPVS